MNLTSPSQVRTFLQEMSISPNRVMGQNFLVDRNMLEAIVEAGELGGDARVLEVGPGLGVVTELLMARAAHVTAVEKDDALFDVLKDRWGDAPGFQLIHGDFLKQEIPALLAAGHFTRLVSNLPYSVGTRILMELAQAVDPIDLMVVTVQLEVGERLAAGPGCSERSLVSVWMQRRYEVDVVRKVSRNCFWPRPDVSSAVVRMRRHQRHELSGEVSARFYEVTKYAFGHRRKQLAGILHKANAPWRMALDDAHALVLDVSGLEKARPADLSIVQWCELAGRLV